MSASQAQITEAALRANRRALELLDQQIEELSRVRPAVTDDIVRARQSLPYSYVADFSGALATTPAGDLISGFVRVDSDSDFILQGIFCSALFDAPRLKMRLRDVGNARDLTIIGRDQRASASVIGTPLGIQMEVFATMNQMARGSVRLPTECTFSRNALIQIDCVSQSSFTFSTSGVAAGAVDPRNFLVLHGTKVFGG